MDTSRYVRAEYLVNSNMTEQHDYSMANNSNDTSESVMSEMMDHSESGVLTEMEEDRLMEASAMSGGAPGRAMDDSGTHGGSDNHQQSSKKGKSKRLTKRVAHSIKKQWKSSDSSSKEKDSKRSVSPPHSGQEYESDSEEPDFVPELSERGETKKKHKSKFKPVAKAAASAARKIAGKKSSSSKRAAQETYEQLQHSVTAESANSSRATSPTENLIHAGGVGGAAATATAGKLGVGKTPGNTPVTGKVLIEDTSSMKEQLARALPSTLTEEEEEEGGDTFEHDKSVELFPQTLKPSSSSTGDLEQPGLVSSEPPAPTFAQPTEDDMLRMAEAMAKLVEKNPGKSHEEIRRMVLKQPEFQHLQQAMGGTPSSSSGSSKKKGFTKSFIGFQSKLTSGAGKVQKGLMEYATGLDSTLGSSVTSFGGFMGSTTSASSGGVGGGGADVSSSRGSTQGPVAGAVGEAVDMANKVATVANTAAKTAEGMVNEAVTTASGFMPTTIPEDSVASINVSVPGSSTSLNSTTATASLPSLSATERAAAVAQTAPAASQLPIKVTDIVWKRRSGFGVLRSSPWERRRFVLQGNSLSYYRAKSESGEGMMDDATERYHEEVGATSKSSTSTKQRMMEALESASTSLGLSAVPGATHSGDGLEASSARGSMDLVKENATICATWGHSGAPSPFCLSIKVKGETKWKLCFASHRAQLQWLAAMTDTVTQASVDSYNIKLLTAADPANHDVTAAFQSHVSEPPTGDKSMPSAGSQAPAALPPPDADNLLPQPPMHVSGRRLWMMEPYVIKAQHGSAASAAEDGDGDDGSLSSDDSDEEWDEDSSPTTNVMADDEEKVAWSLPETKLTLAALLINGAILYCRNSTISAQVFWAVVTVANMLLFSFLEAAPVPTRSAGTVAGHRLSMRRARNSRKRKSKKGGATGSGGAGPSKSDSGALDKLKAAKEKYIPMAGMSAVRIKELSDPGTNAKGEAFTRWRSIDGEDLQVRSHGYLTSKAKIGSPGSLYELTQMDLFESPSRYPDMAPRVKLPKLSYRLDPNEKKLWKSPDYFIVSLALPTDPPKLGSNTSDGGGYTVTWYFTMRKTTRDILKRVTADGYDPNSEEKPGDVQKYQVNAVRLFEEWCRRGPNDKAFLTRFKMVPAVVNAKEIGLPSWIGKYNGKPLLIKRPGQTGFLLPHPELSCIEFDISLHVFPYLAKQGICYLKDTMFHKLLASVGFVIEGRDDDELPEVLIGLGQVCYPDPAATMQGADFFSGKAPRSFEPEEEAKPAIAPAVPVSATLNPSPQVASF